MNEKMTLLYENETISLWSYIKETITKEQVDIQVKV